METSDVSTSGQTSQPPSEQQGFFGLIGVSEAVTVALDPPNPPTPRFADAQVREIAFAAAGAATALIAHLSSPNVRTFSPEDIRREVEAVLASYGVGS